MLHAAELIGVPAQHCLYLGDDKRDMEAGNAAGMTSLIALYGYIDPHAQLDTWQAAGAISSPLDLLQHINAGSGLS